MSPRKIWSGFPFDKLGEIDRRNRRLCRTNSPILSAFQRLLGGVEITFLPLFPDFHGINNILPEDIAAGSDGGKGAQIGIGYPYGEGRVLLSECLSGLYGGVEIVPDEASGGKLSNAEHEG